MKTLWNWIWSIFTLVAIVAIGFGTVWAYNYVSIAFKSQKVEKKKVVTPVETMKVGCSNVENKVVFNASVNPNFSVLIQPKVSGRLERLALDDGTPVVEGVKVKQGELIAKLDDNTYTADVQHAKASVESAKVAVELAKVNLIEAGREKERQDRLLSASAGRSQDYDMAVTSFDRAAAQLKQSLANVAQAEAVLAQRQVSLDETFIYAPLSGVISKKLYHLGSYMTPTTPLVEMLDLDTVKIIIAPPQQYMSKIVLNKTVVRMSSDNWQKTREGVVSRIHPALDPVTRAGRIEVHVANEMEGEALAYRPGMYLTAAILMDRYPHAITIPMSVIIREVDRYIVFKLDGDVVRATEVTLGIKDGENVQILSGLSEGDEIVCNGQYRITDGSQIKRITSKK